MLRYWIACEYSLPEPMWTDWITLRTWERRLDGDTNENSAGTAVRCIVFSLASDGRPEKKCKKSKPSTEPKDSPLCRLLGLHEAVLKELPHTGQGKVHQREGLFQAGHDPGGSVVRSKSVLLASERWTSWNKRRHKRPRSVTSADGYYAQAVWFQISELLPRAFGETATENVISTGRRHIPWLAFVCETPLRVHCARRTSV